MIKRRIVFSYDEKLFIEYAPKFRVHKCPPEFPHPTSIHAHHPYFLDFDVPEASAETGLGDYSYDLNTPPNFDELHQIPIPNYVSQNDLDGAVFEEIVHLLNALTRHHIFTYDHRQAWTVSIGGPERNLRYSQETYLAPDFEDPEEITPQENYFGENLFSLKSEDGEPKQLVTLQSLLDLYFAFDNDSFKQDFLNACLVVDKAKKLRSFEKSASYIFLVSAVEALVDLENRGVTNLKCKCCGQKQYRVMEKFRCFLDKYGWEMDKQIQNDFYNMRSEISHLGQLFQSSYRSNFTPRNSGDLAKQHKGNLELIKHETFQGLVETCFAMFLFRNMQVKDSE